MRVSELFEAKEKKIDEKQLRKDYVQWKKLINMPTVLVKAMSRDKEQSIRTMSTAELKKKYGFVIPQTMARAILKMRGRPLNQWSTVEVNWMHRMLRYVGSKIGNTRSLVVNGEASDKLKDLWAYGHIPHNYKPGKFK